MLKGRLGLDSARIPLRDRHGIIWLRRGHLTVHRGTLKFTSLPLEQPVPDDLLAGDYEIPFQMVTCIVLGPGSTVSHDALRLLARHGTGLVAAGDDGVRMYASMPFGPDRSARARRQVRIWADSDQRMAAVRRMYAWRMGEVFPQASLEALRGMEGVRVRQTYKLLAQQFGVEWLGRRYDRKRPDATDPVNAAINHASTAVLATAQLAVAASGAIPQLGFIHEDSGIAFCLDVADLFRESTTLPAAFRAAGEAARTGGDLERHVRKSTGSLMRKQDTLPTMIDRIKDLLDDEEGTRSGGSRDE